MAGLGRTVTYSWTRAAGLHSDVRGLRERGGGTDSRVLPKAGVRRPTGPVNALYAAKGLMRWGNAGAATNFRRYRSEFW